MAWYRIGRALRIREDADAASVRAALEKHDPKAIANRFTAVRRIINTYRLPVRPFEGHLDHGPAWYIVFRGKRFVACTDDTFVEAEDEAGAHQTFGVLEDVLRRAGLLEKA